MTSNRTCIWTDDEDSLTWHTGCGETTLLRGTPFGSEMAFCCYCGSHIVEGKRIELAEEKVGMTTVAWKKLKNEKPLLGEKVLVIAGGTMYPAILYFAFREKVDAKRNLRVSIMDPLVGYWCDEDGSKYAMTAGSDLWVTLDSLMPDEHIEANDCRSCR